MKIGIIGSGIVGRVLATAFLKEGHEVMLGTTDITKDEVTKWAIDNADNGQVGTFDTTAHFADIIILAVSGMIVEDAIKLTSIQNFTGKIVIDATNPLTAQPPVNGVLSFFTNNNQSLMEKIQKLFYPMPR